MTTQSSLAALETYENLNVEYENAYIDNTFKEACITKAISILASGLRLQDVGCRAGVAVADMLSQAELDVVEFNISPKMVRLAQSRVKGLLTISDILSYDTYC
jgi:2-polyprenyl-3-methyl-5-hydroxy-6-metoxy-1,4-benzoquinol methylase